VQSWKIFLWKINIDLAVKFVKRMEQIPGFFKVF